MSTTALTPEEERKRELARARRRRHRELQSRGEWIGNPRLNNSRIKNLIDAGLLTEQEALDPQKVNAAIELLLDLLANAPVPGGVMR